MIYSLRMKIGKGSLQKRKSRLIYRNLQERFTIAISFYNFLKRMKSSVFFLKRLVYMHILNMTKIRQFPNFAKIGALYAKYSTELAFFDPEMAKQDEKYLKSLISDKRFSDYEYILKKIIKRKAHTISEKEERLIGMAGEIFETFNETFGMIDNIELPLSEIEWEGKKTKISHGLYGIILHSDNREKRKEVYEKYYGAYTSLINTLRSVYYGNVKKDVYLSKVYKYNSCLERALFDEDVDRSVYDNLLKTVDANLPSMHRYVADRKKILGYDKLYFYDINAPLVSGSDFKLPYDEAYEYVVNGLAPLGKEYQALLKKGHDERWIDVEETEGKRSGA